MGLEEILCNVPRWVPTLHQVTTDCPNHYPFIFRNFPILLLVPTTAELIYSGKIWNPFPPGSSWCVQVPVLEQAFGPRHEKVHFRNASKTRITNIHWCSCQDIASTWCFVCSLQVVSSIFLIFSIICPCPVSRSSRSLNLSIFDCSPHPSTPLH